MQRGLVLMDEVTVLIPTYNREKYIKECICSVVGQTHPHFKILIYDDGSTDETVKCVREVNKNLEVGQLKVFPGNEHRGVGYARNFLLKQIETPYACWLDSDDLMEPTRLEKQLAKLKEGPYDIVFSYVRRFSMNGHKRVTKNIIKIDVSKYSLDFKSLKNNTACATGFFRRELQEYDFEEELTLGAEDVLWLYRLLKVNKKVGIVPEPLYLYRFHGQRIGTDKRAPENAARKAIEDGIITQILNRGKNE